MRSWSLTTAFVLALLASAGFSQNRPGMHVRRAEGRAGFRGQGIFFNGGLAGNRHFGFFFNGNDFFFGQHRRFADPFFFGSHRGYGYGYYSGYGAYPYPVVVQTAPASSYYPEEYQQNGKLQRDIDVLTGKSAGTREGVEYGTPAAIQTQESPAPHPATMLLFKDQRTQQIQNYAIVGDTLWVLDDDRAEKVALSDLDLDGTAKLNDARGVQFRLPK